jgi:protein tyrosine/serine phosphatase
MGRTQYRILIVVVALGSLSAGIYRTSVFRPAKNFHEIDPGKFYRSAQLAKNEFEEVVRKHGIRTVINLRGSQPGEWWFDDEKKELDRLNVRMVNLGFSTEQLQTKEDWQQYIDILKTAERPILVHCRSGADRTGEASAVYVKDYMGASREQALMHVSLKYLHVSLFHPAKRLFVENYEGADWLTNRFNPCEPKFRRFARVESGCPALNQ